MIRRHRNDRPGTGTTFDFVRVKSLLTTRRRFLIQAAGGSVALLFGLRNAAATQHDPWPTLDAVMRHLLPSEPDSPGAAEIHALDYLRFVNADPLVDREERDLILQGAQWLDQLSQERYHAAFPELAAEQKEQLLRQVAKSSAGENWISTLLTYLFEALLTAPAYGGNPDGIGWRWLEYVPGFPLPVPGNRYPDLPL